MRNSKYLRHQLCALVNINIESVVPPSFAFNLQGNVQVKKNKKEREPGHKTCRLRAAPLHKFKAKIVIQLSFSVGSDFTADIHIWSITQQCIKNRSQRLWRHGVGMWNMVKNISNGLLNCWFDGSGERAIINTDQRKWGNTKRDRYITQPAETWKKCWESHLSCVCWVCMAGEDDPASEKVAYLTLAFGLLCRFICVRSFSAPDIIGI